MVRGKIINIKSVKNRKKESKGRKGKERGARIHVISEIGRGANILISNVYTYTPEVIRD